jgi:hypothetical protein
MQFYYDVRIRLQNRISGFDYIFEYLKTIENPLIVETGCARQEDNYHGDGQSSLLFDKYINEYGGEFFTVDIGEKEVEYCLSKMICKNTHVTLDDSLNYLKQLNETLLSQNRKIDFLYLDSEGGTDIALHTLEELKIIMPSLKEGCLIGIDDGPGKCRYISEYFAKLDPPNQPVFSAYQTFFKL